MNRVPLAYSTNVRSYYKRRADKWPSILADVANPVARTLAAAVSARRISKGKPLLLSLAFFVQTLASDISL
jgi:hypothetical protein